MFTAFLVFVMVFALAALRKHTPRSKRIILDILIPYTFLSLWLLGNGLWREFFLLWIFGYFVGLVVFVWAVEVKGKPKPDDLANLTDLVYGQADLTKKEE